MSESTANALPLPSRGEGRGEGYVGAKKGAVIDYLILLRPKGFAAAALFVVTGYALAPRSGAVLAADLAILFFGFVLGISGGTLLFNSACDRDTGPVNFLKNPPAPPPHLHAVGLVVMGLGAVVMSLRGPLPGFLGAAMGVLSVGYSYGFAGPRLKDTPPWDLVLNSLGYGAMCVVLGYSVSGAALTRDVLWIAAAFSLSMSASYPASQIFQLKPAEKNAATWLGPARSLRFGAVMLPLAWLCTFVPRTSFGLAYWAFTALFAASTALLVVWSRQPLHRAAERLTLLLKLLLLARVLWIVSVLA